MIETVVAVDRPGILGIERRLIALLEGRRGSQQLFVESDDIPFRHDPNESMMDTAQGIMIKRHDWVAKRF